MKRVLTAVLILAMFLSFVPVYAKEVDTDNNEISLLKKLNIIDNSFSVTEKITKGEFTTRIVKLLYPDMDFSGMEVEGAFFDVHSDSLNGAYIRAAKDLKIVNGDSENMFYPDSELSSTDAVVIACNALGYSVYAKELGGYPTGYLSVAVKYGLTKGLSYKEAIDGGYMAKLLYNTLFLFPASIESISDDGLKISEDRMNILDTVYNIKKHNVILYDNGITSIDGKSVMEEDRCIFYDNKNNAFLSGYAENSDIGEHLGSLMNVYIMYNEKTGKSEVVNYSLDSGCKEYFINADLIVRLNNSGIEYETDRNGESTKIINFNNNLPPVIYNGVLYAGYDINNLVPDDGFLRVCLNDNAVSVIEIISFNIYSGNSAGVQRNIVADTFSKTERYINCRMNPANSLKFDNNDYVKFVMNENIRDFSDLKQDMILSVAQSREKINGGYVYLICASDKKLEGTINSGSQSEKSITVNSYDYGVSDNLLMAKPNFINNIKYGEEGIFYLDVTDKIAYASQNTSSVKNYAYLMAAKVITKADKELVVKLLDKEGEIRELPCSSKIKINNILCSDADMAYNKLIERPSGSVYTSSVKKPVIVTLDNKGEIIRIDTDTPNQPAGNDINIYSTHSHIKYSNEEINDNNALKAGYRNPRASAVDIGKSYSVDGRFYLNSDTVIFSVPDIDMYGLDVWTDYASNQYGFNKKTPKEKIVKEYEGTIDDSYYRLYDLQTLNSKKCYDIQGYDIDPETGYAGLVVLRGRNDLYWYGLVPYTPSYPVGIFLDKSECYDEEFDKMVTKIYYTIDGKNESFAIIDTNNTLNIFKYFIEGSNADENGFAIDVPKLKKGDIIRVITEDGRISHLERVFKRDNLFHIFSSAAYPYIEPTPYNVTFMPYDERTTYASITSNYVIASGYVRSCSSGNIKLMLGKNKVDAVDTSNPFTYTEQVYNTSGIKPIIINALVDENDRELIKEVKKVYQGDFSDIVTTEEVGGDIKRASLVIVKSTEYNTETVIVINREVM